MKTPRAHTAVVLCMIILGACATQQTLAPESIEFRALHAAVESGNTHSMIVLKNGAPIFAYGDVTLTEGTYIASVRKSILSMLYGEWVERGIINLDASLASLSIDDVEGLSDVEKSASVRDLISARSGVYHPASNSSGITEDDPSRGAHAPGDYYWYNNWDFNAAGQIFERLTHKNIYDAFVEQLADPLGLQDFDLQEHLNEGKSGNLERSQFPAYHFFLSTRDLAQLGQLMLRQGEWHGKQLLPANWVAESTSPITPNEQMNPESVRESGFGYGYMWWIFDSERFPPEFRGGFAARGHFGQYIVVLPAIDLVVAHKTLPVDYETAAEYEAINVTWDEFRVLIDLLLLAID